MSELMVKMAKRASEDNSLMASLISHYAEIKGLQWEDIAAQLWIDNLRLAKLALCRQPSKSSFIKDINQISMYVGIEDKRLIEFIRAAEGAQLAKIAKQQKTTQRPPLWRPRGLALAFAFAVLFLILLGSFMFLFPGQPGATLAVSNGQVSVVRLDKLLFIIPRQTAQTLLEGEDFAVKVGDTISIGEGATALLRLADGSTVELLENTRLVVDRLAITDDTYQVRLRMLAGTTGNRVVHSLKAGDGYEVATPSSTISVRGTVFTVSVLSLDWSYVACYEGVVEVKTGDYAVQLQPGEEVYVKVSQLPAIQPIGSAPPQITPDPQPEALPATAPPALPPAQGTPAPGTPAPGTPAPAGVDENGQRIPAPPGAAQTEPPSTDGTTPSDDSPKQVPGKPPGEDEGKPVGGGEPPGQSKKDKPNKEDK